MAYRKVYPSELRFNPKGSTLHVDFPSKTKYSPDLWGIKYLFDQKDKTNKISEICVNGVISKTMALRMCFLPYLFPDIRFHDAEGDKFITDAEDIINNIDKKYVTYESSKHPLDIRGTKDKLESQIEKELADNLSKYIPDFSGGVTVIRQFPANIFRKPISKTSRWTNKLWIDMISVNSAQEVSPVELKVRGNIPLDLFTQGLNYGIYCYLFEQHIRKNWFSAFGGAKQGKVTIYYVGEKFHPALIGRGGEKGITSLIRKNELFNIVFVKIKVDDKNKCIKGNLEIIFDTRKL